MRTAEIGTSVEVKAVITARRIAARPGLALLLGTASVFLATAPVRADSGFWANSVGGSWGNAGNWDSGTGIAGGTDSTAYFGLSLEPGLAPNSTFTLDGAQTVGNLYFTPNGDPGSLVLDTGTGGPLTLSATYGPPAITVSWPGLRVTINAVLGGTSGLTKDGAGTLVLAGANTYSGPTTVSGGTLLVNGQIGSGGVVVQGGTLGGTGTISGQVTVQRGGTFLPGPSISGLVLQAGSSMQVNVNAATSTSDLVQGLGSLTYGGTLTVFNLAGTPALGQSFHIFSSTAPTGNFSSIAPPPGPGLLWRFDPASGVLSVVSAASQPKIASVALNGVNLNLQATNGPPGVACYVLGSADLRLPLASWTALVTNAFDVSGNLSISQAVNPSAPHQFYLLSAPIHP